MAFVHTQKVCRIQPEIIPSSAKQKRKKRIVQTYIEEVCSNISPSRLCDQQSCSTTCYFEHLPSDIINSILDIIPSPLSMRLVCKKMLKSIHNYSVKKLKGKLTYDKSVNPFILYYMTKKYDDITIPKDLIIYYDYTKPCSLCHGIHTGFFVKPCSLYRGWYTGSMVKPDRICVFGCKIYRCQNRNCPEFIGYSYCINELNDLKCPICHKKCNDYYYWTDIDFGRCRQYNVDTPDYAQCLDWKPGGPFLATYGCDSCREHLEDINERWRERFEGNPFEENPF